MPPIIAFLTPLLIVLGIVLFALTLPFWRRDPSPISFGLDDNREQEYADLQVERGVLNQSLQELEMERTQGRMDLADYERLKATDEHRLLQLLDRLETLKGMEQAATDDQSQAASGRKSWVPGNCIGDHWSWWPLSAFTASCRFKLHKNSWRSKRKWEVGPIPWKWWPS